MTINKYFDLYKTPVNEQSLYKGMFAESIQIYGRDVHYILRDIENEDYFFTEDVLSSFNHYFTIEMYIEDYEGFTGERDFLSTFGLQIPDQLILTVSQDRFLEETGMEWPREGDLIHLPLDRTKASASLFEIKFVEDEQQFYPLGSLVAFKLECELFRYNQQDLDTGIEDVDLLDEETDDGFDPFAQNDDIENEADNLLVIDPNDPFGTY